MNQNSFEISLYSYNYGNVQFESSWTNNTTLNIDPLVVLQANTTYYLNIAGSSLDNNNFSGNYVFSTIEGISFISTNLERVDGVFNEFPITSNIELMFSMAIDWGTYGGFVYLYDSYNNVIVGVPTVSTNKVIFNPTSDLEFNEDYIISWRIYSSIDGDYDSGNIYFSTEIE